MSFAVVGLQVKVPVTLKFAWETSYAGVDVNWGSANSLFSILIFIVGTGYAPVVVHVQVPGVPDRKSVGPVKTGSEGGSIE